MNWWLDCAYFNVHSTSHPVGEIRGNIPSIAVVDDDADGDTLFVTEVNGNSALVGTSVTLSSGALVVVGSDGMFSYNPNGQFDSLAPGESSTDSFSYTINDGHGQSSIANVTITVLGKNETLTVTLFADDPTAGEGTPADPGRFTVTRAGDLSGNLTVNYAISGTASSGDYTQTLSGTVTIPDQSAR